MKFNWHTDYQATSLRICSDFNADCFNGDFGSMWSNSFLVMDSRVAELWKSKLAPVADISCGQFLMDASEEFKTPKILADVWLAMAEAGVRRDTGVIIAGGGLTCDIGAMAASTFQRGLRLMLIPTTLLCMVDACLGGKTGVNLSGIKNQIGTFLPAEEILLIPDFLDTLPPREFRSGLAEALKTSLIGDPQLREIIVRAKDNLDSRNEIAEMVRRCLEVKAEIAGRDLRESGARMVLNLGHTVGHALESIGSFSLSHGEAVGLGLIAEAAMAWELGGRKGLVQEISQILRIIGLPSSISEVPDWDILRKVLDRDKKSREDCRKWAIPFDWGDCRIVSLTPEEEESILPASLGLLKS